MRIALTAGHYIGTSGKRCLKSIDKNETREWVLNNRICEKIESKLSAYDGYSLIRTDDRSGQTDVALKARVDKANSFDADIYISVHHNAGINGGVGGGVMAYVSQNAPKIALEWQKDLYDRIIAHTGLKGNRATPCTSASLYECRETKMPAVLLECGFMDSKTDVPIILTDAFADKVASAIVEVIAARGNLSKKASRIYRVQVGAYSVKANAERMRDKLKEQGFDAIIV
jgi:N-acetylmuramoyl-L-alanine amidase